MNGIYAVAGASGAIGKQICHRIVKSGGIPLLIGRSYDLLLEVKDELLTINTANNNTIINATNDNIKIISDIDFMNPLLINEKIISHYKQNNIISLSGLVYAVGSITIKPLKTCKIQDYIDSYNVNVLGGIELIKSSLNVLKYDKTLHNPASIVLFSSVAVQHGFNNHSIISCSKGAIEGLTKSLACELIISNIRVNCIAPSLTNDSKMGLSMTTNIKMAESIAKTHPIQRLGTPNDSAAACEYLLLNNYSSWVTGTILQVDGGKSSIIK